MRQTFNEIARKTGAIFRYLFPEKINSHGIFLGAGPGYYGSLRYAVHENPRKDEWNVKAILFASSRLSGRIHFTRAVNVASFPEKQEALDFMARAEPNLGKQAHSLLLRMGISDPAACFPAIAQRTAKSGPAPSPQG